MTSLSVGVASDLVFLPRKDVPRYLIDPDDFSGRIPDGYIHLREKAVEGMRLFRKEVERGFPSFTRSMDGNAD